MRQRLDEWRLRYRSAPRGAQVGLAAAAVVVLVAMLACATTGGFQSLRVALFASSESPPAAGQPPFTSIATTTAHPTSPGATTTVTTTPNPTTTPARPIPQSSATLGGSVFAFDDHFGDANCCLLSGWTYRTQYGPLWTGVYTGGATNSPTSFDWRSTDRVTGIDNQPTDTVSAWTMSQASAICGGFLPADAQRTGNLTRTAQGQEQRYVSASLARTLPASAFRDIHGKQATPGTIYVFYETDAGNNVSQCALSSDEHFAQNPFAIS